MNIQDAYTRWSTNYNLDPNPTHDLDQIVTKQTLANQTILADALVALSS